MNSISSLISDYSFCEFDGKSKSSSGFKPKKRPPYAHTRRLSIKSFLDGIRDSNISCCGLVVSSCRKKKLEGLKISIGSLLKKVPSRTLSPLMEEEEKELESEGKGGGIFEF